MFNIVYIIILPETLVGLQLGYELALQNIGGFKVLVSVKDCSMYNVFFFFSSSALCAISAQTSQAQAHPITGSP